MNNCYIYTRVSTDEQAQEGFSLENQKRACLEYARLNRYEPQKVFCDDGKSARTLDRPAFQELLSSVNAEPPKSIIFYKIDRFARDLADFANLRKELKNKGIKLLSVNEGDFTDSPMGGMFAVWAEWESVLNGQRTRDALWQKFREGWLPRQPPIGYRSIGGDRERKTCEPDQYEAPIIKDLFQLYATGNYSILELQDWLAKKNITSRTGTGLGHSVICNIINNPFYYGLIRWHGQSKMGNHRPIISKELFDTCQYVAAKHRSFLIRHQKYDFLLRGFIYCKECGQRYTAEPHYDKIKLKKRNGVIFYYHCQKRDRNGCPAPYVELSDLEKQVGEEISKFQFSQEFIDAVVRKTREMLDNNRLELDSHKQGIINQKSAAETRRNKLEDALLDGLIDREAFKRKHEALETEIRNYNLQIEQLENKNRIDIDLIEEVLAFTRNIYKSYLEAPPFLKRHFLRFFIEKIIVKNKGICEVVPTPIFATLRQNQLVIITQPQLPSPHQITISISKILKAFEDIIQVELLKVRWEEIKRLQSIPAFVESKG